MSCLTYSAGQLYAATATDDPFVMTSTTNAMDILATALALPLADKWGRRPSMVCAYGLAALCYIGVAGFYEKHQAVIGSEVTDGRSGGSDGGGGGGASGGDAGFGGGGGGGAGEGGGGDVEEVKLA
ncbi:hypothetical protein V5799_018990 [Amblyomma americanum]|uniref:Uncharacterized protein n=1 Tax=Amblyomma americanum TaxID=6943 RepID=A0AAQ4EYR7_AMBAM